MQLRRAVEADLTAIGALTVAAYAPFLQGDDDPYVARLRDAATRHREADLWVATGGSGDILGTVTLCPPGSPWREISREGESEFRMLAVDPAAQGRGVGDALVRRCLEEARRGRSRAMVLCSLGDMSSAHRLYGRLGFTRLPERDWQPLPGFELLAFHTPLEEP